MQTRRRGGHSTGFPGKHGLVALPVFLGIFPGNIRWQGHMTVLFQLIQHRRIENEHEQIPVPTFHRCLHHTLQAQPGSGSGGLARPHMGQGRLAAGDALHQDFHLPASLHLAALETRRDDAGIVEHQQVIGRQQLRKITDLPVGQLPRWPIQAQQTGPAAIGQRGLGNEFLREEKVEVADLHGARW